MYPGDYLEMSVNKPIHIKVIIILSEGIDQHFSNLEPSHVKEELEGGKDWEVEVHLMTIIILAWVKIQSSQQGGEEKGIHGQSDNLHIISGVNGVLQLY